MNITEIKPVLEGNKLIHVLFKIDGVQVADEFPDINYQIKQLGLTKEAEIGSSWSRSGWDEDYETTEYGEVPVEPIELSDDQWEQLIIDQGDLFEEQLEYYESQKNN